MKIRPWPALLYTCLVFLVFSISAGTATAQTAIPPGFAHPAGAVDTAKPGFRVRTVQATETGGGVLPNSLARAEEQLAGLLVNTATGTVYENIADAAVFGSDGFYNEELVIDYNVNGSMPGIPGAEGLATNVALEALAYLVLEPGAYTMVVRSDDGFRVTASPDPRSRLGELTLGFYDGGRGAGDSVFSFTVSAAGAYGFRLLYEQGGGDGVVSWFMADPADESVRVLLNDPNDAASVKTWRELTIPQGPVADILSPAPGSTTAPPRPTLTVRLADSASSQVNPGSVRLFLDGAEVTPTVVKTGDRTLIKFTPAGLLRSASAHTVKLSYADLSAVPVVSTSEYQFTVASYADIILSGPPVVSENFDTWEEQTEAPAEDVSRGWQYHGWTVEHYSNPGNGIWDLDDPKSDAYQGWVVLSKDRVTSIGDAQRWETARRLNTPEQYVNGKRVESLVTGNFFYAESDQRGDSQVQYLFSPDYDLSTRSGVYLYYHGIYEQNQDNIASVEYSIDKGASWLPVIYMVDAEDILRGDDGNIDAEATLNEPRNDAASYSDPETGETVGGFYGAFIGAKPETWSQLGPYISGRVNDDQGESKRVEYFSLPRAGGQAAVRFRFAQAGTASWYFGIDNFALHAEGAAGTPPPVLSVAKQADGKILLSWPSSATGWQPESSAALTEAWTALPGAVVAGDQTTVLITPAEGKRFYRLRKQE